MHPISSSSTVNLSRSKIGIITGSGPEAGIDLWAKLLHANREIHGAQFRGDLDAPNVTILSEPALGLSMELDLHDAAVWECLRNAASAIAQRVDYYAIACNTLNHYQLRLDALGLPAKLVSFADVVVDYLKQSDTQRVALLGARPVTDLGEWSHYRKLAAHVQVEPLKAVQAAQLHQLIYDVKTYGGAAPQIRDKFRALLDGLEARTVLLACTELPLIQMQPDDMADKHLVDVTALVARKLAQLANQAPAPTA
ncbi:aspartate/glutamate racemase family protein [Noviherbaspirillum saxi]|uniref:Aspartate/glutamate racemase family protein n=1 Tax=Noviherbaspirillum saxi TaxID=2320863 RepID=A0A3A3G5X4_9BURK|nr:aspartate/glutamate racemase family protein [Noviherbaspirillum saxi]RJF97525.1 aspartate/glutamate racemase family protein [Noviherbaspirillum saxi]